jgi:O-antigen/teichoic acid export membrane protein
VTGTREIHDRAQRSLWLVLSRQALVALVTFGSGVVLARTLSPADFGVFAISTFIVVFVGMIADLGLHSALIQRRIELSTHDLRAAFTVQQLAAAVAFAVLWPAAPLLRTLYPDAAPELVGLVRLMSADLFLLAWCRPSEALLERSLRYERLVPIDVAGATVYGLVAIVLALSGAGVWSFGIAWVASTVTRLLLVSRAAPWPIGLAWDATVARQILRIGAPLQLSRVVAQAQYWVTPTVVAATLGPAAAGLLQWAAGNGRKPLDVLEYLARVSLPHFSRLQHDDREIERTLERYVTGFVLASSLWLAVLALAGRDLVHFIYTDRWLPAVPAMVLFAAVALVVSVRVIVTTALAGTGRTMLVGRMTLWGAAATIVASVALVPAIGMLGVPLGQLVGAAVVLPPLVAGLGSSATASVRRAVGAAIIPTMMAVVVGLAVRYSPLEPVARGLVTSVAIAGAFAATVWLLGPRWVRGLWLRRWADGGQ